jgi:competence protein ComEA
MGRLTRTEIVCLTAAAVFLTAAAGVRLGSSVSGGEVSIRPALRAQAVSDSPAEETPALSDSYKVDINSADTETLSLLPGIGETLAGRIVEYREKNGAFSEISDIMDVSGIGQGTFDKIKDYITVEEVP